MRSRNMIFLIIFIPFIILAQNNSVSRSSVRDFFKYVDKYTPKSKDSIQISLVIPDDEVELIRIAYQNAIEINPYEYKTMLKSLTEKWVETGNKGLYGPISLKPAFRVKLIKDKLIELYGKDFVNILSTPIIVKVFLKEIQDALYISPDNDKLQANQTNLIVEIQEILKGKDHFNCGQEISISYLNWWYKDNEISFEIGKSYLLPIEPWYGKKDNFKSMIIKDPTSSINIIEIHSDRIKSICPIKNEYEILWTEFRENFSKKYLIK